MYKVDEAAASAKLATWFRRNPRNAWLTLCFLTYIAFLFVFAALYYWVYGSDQEAFSFNSDIARTQYSTFQNNTDIAIASLLSQLDFWTRIQRSCVGRDFIEENREWFNMPDGKITCRDGLTLQLRNTRRVEHGDPVPEWDMILVDSRYGELGRTQLLHGLSPSATSVVTMADISRSRLNYELAAKRANRAKSRAWGFWDFLYFSTITQTTVGYGDILPNSTLVRMIVVTQIVLGYAVIVLMFNFVFRHEQHASLI